MVVVKAPKDTALVSRINEQTKETEIEIVFGRESKGSVFTLTRK